MSGSGFGGLTEGEDNDDVFLSLELSIEVFRRLFFAIVMRLIPSLNLPTCVFLCEVITEELDSPATLLRRLRSSDSAFFLASLGVFTFVSFREEVVGETPDVPATLLHQL